MMGPGAGKHFTNYHCVLNRARWSPWVLNRLLLALLIRLFLPAGAPLLLVVDETLERRRGPKNKGWFRDPLRSTLTHVSKCLGIRRICLALLMAVPWSPRLWALPFMLIPDLGPQTGAKLKKRHHTLVE